MSELFSFNLVLRIQPLKFLVNFRKKPALLHQFVFHIHNIHHVHRKKATCSFAMTEIVHKFPSNLAGSCSSCAATNTVSVKTSHFTWHEYTRHDKNCNFTELSTIPYYQQKPTQDLRQKQLSTWHSLLQTIVPSDFVKLTLLISFFLLYSIIFSSYVAITE